MQRHDAFQLRFLIDMGVSLCPLSVEPWKKESETLCVRKILAGNSLIMSNGHSAVTGAGLQRP